MVARACEAGCAGIAITDHDTLAGLGEGAQAAAAAGLEFLPGTEVSAVAQNVEVHVIGLGVQPDSAPLCDALAGLREGRSTRADAMIGRLNELGMSVTRERVEAQTGDGTIGRLHIAKEVHRLGHVKTVQGAFDAYIGEGRPAFVPKALLPCREAIEVLHRAGGLAIMGHPGIGRVERILAELLDLPFDGIEVYHSQHSSGQASAFKRIAEERGLLISGGSDCHGGIKGQRPELGTVRVPYTCFEAIKAALIARTRS